MTTPAKRGPGRPRKEQAPTKAPPRLTTDQLDQIKHADLANLIRKVKAGKTLSPSERKMLESAAEADSSGELELVTLAKICQLFTITRKTIAQWRRNGMPGIPEKESGKENLREWRKFFASNPSAGHYDGKPRKDRESLLCEKLEVEIAIAKLKYDAACNELVSIAEVEDVLAAIGAAVKGAISRLEADLPPMLEGMKPAKMQLIVRDKCDEVLALLEDQSSKVWQRA